MSEHSTIPPDDVRPARRAEGLVLDARIEALNFALGVRAAGEAIKQGTIRRVGEAGAALMRAANTGIIAAQHTFDEATPSTAGEQGVVLFAEHVQRWAAFDAETVRRAEAVVGGYLDQALGVLEPEEERLRNEAGALALDALGAPRVGSFLNRRTEEGGILDKDDAVRLRLAWDVRHPDDAVKY